MVEDRLTFKQMCARFDVTPRTLRYYEYIELLDPERDGRSRLYGPRETARMTLILRGRRFGFSLEDIRQWLILYDAKGSAAQLAEFLRMAERQIAVLTRERADLDRTIAELCALHDETAAILQRREPPVPK